ncbi:hypothetical protein B5S28_g5209 [[Candida] boidinii]|nr:hypothetical protein B5S28_g5209 [[Candida] boidinii]OWB63778.1 hypothetical protein B5S29_g4787 [[Candida] boidinii]OWB75163.1 hypothetical protein B5S31_g5025 [[Candida] boidinii]OWB79611.1 hypothetical protein B5S32_g3840 [[Candida] boidinii]
MSFLQGLSNNFNSANTINTIRSTRGFRRNVENSPTPIPQGQNGLQFNSKLNLHQLSENQQQSQQQQGQQGQQSQSQQVASHKEIRNFAESTFGSGSALAQAVKLPKGEDSNEWLAVHVVDFYNQINMLYGTITEFCSPNSCPRMIATQEYEYLWQDPTNRLQKQPVSMSAPGYVEALMIWIQSFLDDDSIFPTKMGVPFPPQFPTLVKTIMKRLFRVYAHIYCHHFDEITELNLQTHLNTSLKHFVLFCREFNLLSQKDYGPLSDLVSRMIDDSTNQSKN